MQEGGGEGDGVAVYEGGGGGEGECLGYVLWGLLVCARVESGGDGRGGSNGRGACRNGDTGWDGTYGMHELLDFLPQRVLALDGRQREVDLRIGGASDVGDEVSQVVWFLELDFAMDLCHVFSSLCSGNGSGCVGS